MNKSMTKRTLILSLASLVLCFTMLLGTTFAWFTDSVTSTGNKIASGTLKVDLEVLASLLPVEPDIHQPQRNTVEKENEKQIGPKAGTENIDRRQDNVVGHSGQQRSYQNAQSNAQ